MSIDDLSINISRMSLDDDLDITRSSKQTKDWRLSQEWYGTGKSNECEKYQICKVKSITCNDILKTTHRINLETNMIVDQNKPLTKDDGFEYTEDFDALQVCKDLRYYYNLKFVCGSGGAQTRTLREVYHYITAQLDYLLTCSDNNERFVNILDGDCCYRAMSKYKYLLSKPKYTTVRKRVFVGDMMQFYFIWKSSGLK